MKSFPPVLSASLSPSYGFVTASGLEPRGNPAGRFSSCWTNRRLSPATSRWLVFDCCVATEDEAVADSSVRAVAPRLHPHAIQSADSIANEHFMRGEVRPTE